MVVPELQAWLEKTFGGEPDQALLRGVSEGVALADGLMDSEPFLRTLVGRDLQGHVRRAAVMFRLRDLCLRGELPWGGDIVKMPIGNWHHLELQPAPSVVGYVCKTDSPLAFPRDTPNRQHERLTGQGSLFDVMDDNVVSLSAVMAAPEEKCVWMTYGVTSEGSISHLCWNLPSSVENSEGWLAHINILERIRRSGNDRPTARPADPKDVVKFKLEIDEALRAQDKRADNEELE